MDNSRRHGRPDEEMFLQSPHGEGEAPTIGPLRINKTGTSSSSPPPPRTGSAASGASSSHLHFAPPPKAPLPYPDDRPTEQESRSKTSTPQEGRARVGSSSGGAAPPSPHRAKFSASDPNRPTLGYGHAALPGASGGLPKPLPDSPGPETPDKDELFAKPVQRTGTGFANPFPEYHQQYWPPPNSDGAAAKRTQPQQQQQQGGLAIPAPAGINRLSSTASTSTTRAERGSPPPPETPVVGVPGGGIESRYAAAGIAGTGTLTGMQSAAAAQRAAQYPAPRQQTASTSPPQQAGGQQPPRRPWTPTEAPGSAPHGPTAVYQGMNEITTANLPPRGQNGSPQVMSRSRQHATASAEAPLENDMSRLNVHEDAPPAYSTLHPGQAPPGGYPNEKGHAAAASAAAAGAAAVAGASAAGAGGQQMFTAAQHPAFANDAAAHQNGIQQPQPQASPSSAAGHADQTQKPSTSPAPGQPTSPPPLPEGWIAHLDSNSGQYYYIHLPTQSTQWEFPKGPTPLNLNEPLSPTGTFVNPLASPVGTTFGSKLPLASPGLPVQQHAMLRPDSMMTMTTISTPTAAGFTGPPPTAGIDMYKVAPTNGVYFGPYLRYTNMDPERGIWLGSILLVTEAPQPPTIHIHQSTDLSPNPRQLKSNPIYSHQRWMFYRYDIDLQMDAEQSVKWTYAITSHLGCTRYEFVVAGRTETSWRFIAHSGNDFALNVSANDRQKLGGIGYMWKDILQKHIECNGFHAQLGLGDQIFADRLWKEIPLLKQWTATSGKDNRRNAAWSAKHEDDVTHAYFHYYTSHFDQPHLREAFAQIPHVLSINDHDIFDGFGSYPEYMQFSNMFKNIGRIGIEMYLLFQHHTTLEILRNVNNDLDLFTITGTGWHFVKYLGPAVVVVGPDCRSERNQHQVMAGPTYQGLFPKIATLPPSVQHCIWMIPDPVVYPRMENVEQLASTVATGKKAVTGTFNMLGKMTSSVAGVVGAKGVVSDGFNSVKKAVGKSGLMSGMLSPFGDIDMLDELRDQWTHESKDLERTYLVRTLQGISHNKSLRMTIFSGSVSCCGAGMLHDPAHPQDHKSMYQIISSSVVDAPPSNYVLRLLHNNKALYVPANGHRSTGTPSDTKEDMLEIFGQDVDGRARELKRLMGRRNYVACVAFDPDVVQGAFGQTVVGAHHQQAGGAGTGRLSLAVDFLVQNEGGFGVPMKYGPVVIPHLEYGR